MRKGLMIFLALSILLWLWPGAEMGGRRNPVHQT